MWKIIKITKENTSWEQLLFNWESCNEERLDLAEDNRELKIENKKYLDKLERIKNISFNI